MEKIYVFFFIGFICINLAVAAVYFKSRLWTNLIDDEEFEKLIIDTDGGPDDALAILLAIFSNRKNNNKKFDIIGITCTYGNSYLKNVEKNILKTLTIANINNIPVYSGAEKPLENDFNDSKWFGDDGFGDFKFEKNIKIKIDKSKNATTALVDLARKYSKKLTILSLGPLTNIALAIEMDPNFVNHVGKFYIMGGSISGNGNMGANLEFNFMLDPESNEIVFNSLTRQSSYLIPWEPLVQTNISWSWKEKEVDGMNTTISKFLKLANAKAPKEASWIPADGFAAAVMICSSEFFIEKSKAKVTPIITDEHRGEIIVNYSESSFANIIIVQKINTDEFKKFFIETFSLF